MSRFSEASESSAEIVSVTGIPITGAFECNSCSKVVASAINDQRNGKIWWECPDGHTNEIDFKL